MKNMKIEVSEDQPIEDVLSELKRLGRKYTVIASIFEGRGTVTIMQLDALNCTYGIPVREITLAELKEMK